MCVHVCVHVHVCVCVCVCACVCACVHGVWYPFLHSQTITHLPVIQVHHCTVVHAVLPPTWYNELNGGWHVRLTPSHDLESKAPSTSALDGHRQLLYAGHNTLREASGVGGMGGGRQLANQ